MGFNAKAFAASFMADSARQINERVAEAREYKRELKENAEAGKTKITQLRQLGNLAKSEISRLRSLGFEDKHINAAIASGPKGLFDLSVSAQEEAARRNFTSGQKFDEYEIESLIDFSENFAYGDVKSEEFYKMNTALTDPSLGSTQDPQRGLMKTIFGIDLDDSVRSKLDKDAFYDGYSVMQSLMGSGQLVINSPRYQGINLEQTLCNAAALFSGKMPAVKNWSEDTQLDDLTASLSLRGDSLSVTEYSTQLGNVDFYGSSSLNLSSLRYKLNATALATQSKSSAMGCTINPMIVEREIPFRCKGAIGETFNCKPDNSLIKTLLLSPKL